MVHFCSRSSVEPLRDWNGSQLAASFFLACGFETVVEELAVEDAGALPAVRSSPRGMC